MERDPEIHERIAIVETILNRIEKKLDDFNETFVAHDGEDDKRFALIRRDILVAKTYISAIVSIVPVLWFLYDRFAS